MIFVTIGSAFPFDRLIKAMDAWATETGRGDEVLMQIGKGTYRPAHTEWRESLTETDFAETVRQADVVVSHAGMGSVITAMRFQTPIVMLPRRFEAGEHTTDHQMATARWLAGKPGVFVAWEEGELGGRIVEARGAGADGDKLYLYAQQAFTNRLRDRLTSWLERLT